MKRLKLFIPLIIFVVLGVLFYAGLGIDPTHLPSALIDKPVPTFEAKVLGEDRLVTDEELKGKPYLLNIWATWCPTCRVENPFFVELSKIGVKIVGVNYKDDDQAALNWLEKFGNPYVLNIVDTEGRLGLDLGVYGAPETFVVDSKGIIRYKHVGVVDRKTWQRDLAPFMQ